MIFDETSKKIKPWWARGHGALYDAGMELLISIEYCQGLAQFHPNKIGGWIPKLVC